MAGSNLYSYVGGDAINHTDPTGRIPVLHSIGNAIANSPVGQAATNALAGAAATAAVYYTATSDAVSEAVGNAVDAVGEAVSDAVGAAGEAISDLTGTVTLAVTVIEIGLELADQGTRPGDLPATGEPDSTATKDDGKGNGQIREYGEDGRAVIDFDFGHDHGSGDPHAHDWDWSKADNARGPHRPIGPGE